jgi:hypothetical protein
MTQDIAAGLRILKSFMDRAFLAPLSLLGEGLGV